ncbi:hypothetical protein K458DRAFT_398025 [Lentithecium fluviatile CBS 122367]|uniref:Uncharacterized protein n=1 Tax=Lentithecium fluviatile CBS 122367 TaxID=1168545 RepID=A0A6G1JLY0_9PLEO|nr:hypothetical protein K458DRAFT_398025 [Lentithecium fluviatile CBS 122367]
MAATFSSGSISFPFDRPADNETFVYFGRTYNCTIDNTVDPDVAGIGVIISFLASAAISFVAILVGYFQNTLPGFPKHPMDSALKGRVCRLILRRKYDDTLASEEAQEAFQNFILALSDQQLVTGLAVLVSAYLKADITLYSFQVVSALAWFSSVIHLATLVVLKKYLRENPGVRYVRIAVMLAIAGLLLASQIQSSGKYQYAPWSAMHCVRDKSTPPDVLSLAFITIWLFFAFTNRIVDICTTGHISTSRSWPFEKIMSLLSAEEGTGRTSEDILRNSKWVKSPQKTLTARFGTTLVLLDFVWREFAGSFAWEIAWLIFAFAYGLVSTIVAWSSCAQLDNELGTCWGSVLEMGFGQMVPLILLLLPFFGLLEFKGSQNKSISAHNDATEVVTDVELQTTAHVLSNTASGVDNNRPLGQSVEGERIYRDIKFIQEGGDPYETRTVQSFLAVVALYCIAILAASGTFSALNGTVNGFLVSAALVLCIYIYGLLDEVSEIVRVWKKKGRNRASQ